MPHVPIDLDAIKWDQYFSTIQSGRGVDAQNDRYFVGQKYMRGYGFLGTIGKFLLPVAKNLAESLGNEGIAAGTRIMKDVAEGKEFGDALKEHSKKGLENIGDKIKQCGKGRKKSHRKSRISLPSKISLAPQRNIRRKRDQLDIF